MKKISASKKIVENMKLLGLITDVSGGVQIDINVAIKKLSNKSFVDAPLCDHNCRTITNGKKTGNYDCPAAKSLHPNLSIKSITSARMLIKGAKKTAQGIKTANLILVQNKLLKTYYQKFKISSEIQNIIQIMLKEKPIEINLFGGNPELHPELGIIIDKLKRNGFIINLTTTGGRFIYDPKFLRKILDNPPDILALSADDFESVEQINNLAKLSAEKVVSLWRTTPVVCGQQRKAIEAIFVAKLSQKHRRFPKILFNLVVHQGNLLFIEKIIKAIRRNFSNAIVNPYPGQSSFYYGPPIFQKQHLEDLEKFIDVRITEQLSHTVRLVPRIHYWLMLKSIFHTHRNNFHKIIKKISGYNTWTCYRVTGARRYIQIGISPKQHAGAKVAGGHLSCFWNTKTVTDKTKQSWDMNVLEITSNIIKKAGKIAKESNKPCPGCIMPRLNFDMLSLELGMSNELVPAYLSLRKQYAGF